MSLPPGFLDELKTRTSLARVVGRKVSWDMRKSNQGKGDFWAACPFHTEKSASFHVDDKQGFYYCFGCQAKGDALKFVQETENVGFMEAIEILAREAGMTVPAADPKAREVADRRSRLAEVMDQAVAYYRLQLKTAGATAARDYLAKRGLRPAMQDRFDLGYAPDSRSGILDALKAKGVAEDLIVAAGLATMPDAGGPAYAAMRGRIVFPIRDARGRCIAFGGRAMDPNARAKYLNTRETELFDKGRSLYNHAPAREAAGKGKPLVVAEGYMDVIALVQAGFEAALAPLGTAVTEEQLRLLWRIADEPVIALDGDRAGFEAALRVIDRSLPLLEAGKGLRFAILPQGLDPDDLIRTQGAPAMQDLLDKAQSMVALLWRRETEGKTFDSPERRAALDRDLRATLKTIRDPSIRRHYADAIQELRQDLFRPARPQRAQRAQATKGRWQAPAAPVLATTRSSALAALPEGREDHLREALVLAVLIAHPEFLPEFETMLERIELTDPVHAALRATMLRHPGGGLREAIVEDQGAGVLERLFARSHICVVAATSAGAAEDEVRTCLTEEMAKLLTSYSQKRELGDAIEDLDALPDEGVTWRLTQAVEARHRAVKAESQDRTLYEVAENGVELDRAEREKARALFDEVERNQARKLPRSPSEPR
jgi:DNA primase